MPSKCLTVQDKDTQSCKNKIKFLFDSLEKAEEKADITVYKNDDKIIDGLTGLICILNFIVDLIIESHESFFHVDIHVDV